MISYKSIRADVSQEMSYVYEKVKQYDNLSRKYRIMITDKGNMVSLKGNEAIRIRMWADGELTPYVDKWLDEPWENGYPILIMTSTMLSKIGKVKYEFVIQEPGSPAVISTRQQNLLIQKSLINYDGLIASEDFDVLSNLIAQALAIPDLISDFNVSQEEANNFILQIQNDIASYQSQFADMQTNIDELIRSTEDYIQELTQNAKNALDEATNTLSIANQLIDESRVLLGESEQHVNDSGANAALSESWAIGKKGLRPDENTNNSEYFSEVSASNADRAKAEADRAESYAGQANPGALTGTEATDTQGLLGAPGATVWAQTLIDKMIDNNITDEEIDDLDELVYIPKFKNSDVLVGGDNNTHPAFIVNGKEIPGFYYSKYQNVVKTVDGVNMAYSLYGKDPAVSINFDNARARCEAKGKGYHLSTNAEWAAIALWCKKNGYIPYGNNGYGKDSRESDYIAIPTSQVDNKTARVATGTGPITWSHDETQSGIWDLNGNVSEWQGGIRIVWGELQILENNNASDPNNSQSDISAQWKAINAADGTLIEPESKTTDTAARVSGNTVKIDYINSVWTYSTGITSSTNQSRNCLFARISTDATVSEEAKVQLRALALLPDTGMIEAVYESDLFYVNNGANSQVLYRGGGYSSVTGAGVFYLRTELSSANYGFRSAYISES